MPAPLAIEDALPAGVIDCATPAAEAAQALHATVVTATATAPIAAAATTPAAATATILAVIGLGRQFVAACASPFGIGQGGIARRSPTDLRARDIARRAAEAFEIPQAEPARKQKQFDSGKRRVLMLTRRP